MKINKRPGYSDISFNVLKKCFSSLCEPLMYLFNLSIKRGIFLDVKITQVTPIYKVDDKSNLSNYRLISVLSCFSKILERIMYNGLYQYISLKIKFSILSNLVSRRVTQLKGHSYSWLIKFLNLLNTINILQVFLSTYLKSLIQSII